MKAGTRHGWVPAISLSLRDGGAFSPPRYHAAKNGYTHLVHRDDCLDRYANGNCRGPDGSSDSYRDRRVDTDGCGLRDHSDPSNPDDHLDLRDYYGHCDTRVRYAFRDRYGPRIGDLLYPGHHDNRGLADAQCLSLTR